MCDIFWWPVGVSSNEMAVQYGLEMLEGQIQRDMSALRGANADAYLLHVRHLGNY